MLENAFKFTRSDGHVLLEAHASKGRVLIEVGDEGGGLPVGLGPSIGRKAVEANGGSLYARDIPGRGCVTTIDLPRKEWPHAGDGRPNPRSNGLEKDLASFV